NGVRLENGTTVTNVHWYQFRIPLRTGTPVNGIQNFKAIDFIRMYLTNFSKEVILRIAKMQLVSTQWRNYQSYLGIEGEVTNPEPDNTFFEIATVNIEENGSKKPFNYVIPPDIVRQGVPGSPIQGLLQNEQSLVLKTCDLKDGAARAAFKTVNYDMRNYKRLKMWVHAEQTTDGVIPSNFDSTGDLRLFIRLGSDFVSNYYEYEMPLTPSDPTGPQSVENIWRNQVDFAIQDLNRVKQLRNDRREVGTASFTEKFVDYLENGQTIAVIGNPQLNHIKNIMIGIRNPKDDGRPICAEVWVNELRVTDFDEFSGYAANARLNIKLADLGNVSLSGSRGTPGFGSIEKKLNERSREDMTRYDVALNLNVGKLLPKKLGLEIPLYVTYGERIVDPQFNPLDPDILMTTRLNAIENPTFRDSVRNASRDYTLTRSYSLSNVRKVKTGKNTKSHFWDIENFSFTYSFAETYQHNAQTEIRLNQNYRAGIGYNFSANPKAIEPFKSKKGKKNLITEFNFYLLPKSVSIRIDGDRRYEEMKLRSTANSIPIAPTYNQN
ncbi:MAG: cell surface protein SprA, partial [Bacteroidia bacterium]|nr:cell surface protein SprA [Bacteroidia bacterium]